jgi:hypothetical protein
MSLLTCAQLRFDAETLAFRQTNVDNAAEHCDVTTFNDYEFADLPRAEPLAVERLAVWRAGIW